jgi:hypothetical protein
MSYPQIYNVVTFLLDILPADDLDKYLFPSGTALKVRERLNVGTVPTFKMHHVGTVPTFKMHHVGSVPTFKMHHVGTLNKYNCIKLICYYQSIQCEPSEPIPLYL